MASGRYNVALGFLFIAGFAILGFVLIYLRDLSPGRADWIAQDAVGAHFETRLAHAHGNLFTLVNVALGVVLARLQLSDGAKRGVAWLGLGGMLMPVGILAEVVFGLPPVLVIMGGASMLVAVTFAGVAALRTSVMA